MSDTIMSMELIHADNLNPGQLMPEDLIKIDDDIVEVLSIESDATGDKYFIETQNEFGEKQIEEFAYTDIIQLYVFIEHDDD
jgi:hypothetical protein